MSRHLVCAVIAALILCVTGCQPYSSAPVEHELQDPEYGSYDVAPDGHTMLFTGPGLGKVGQDLYLYDTLTKHMRRLTHTPEYKNYAAFSPDGKRLVYESAPDLDSPRYLYLRSLDGRNVRQLTSGEGVADSSPSFSRDGKTVVFARANVFYADRRGENTWDKFDVYTIHADGTGLHRLTHGNYGNVIRPRFSPDGTYVLYEGAIFTSSDISDKIMKIDSAGEGVPIRMVDVADDSCPYFFPDGTKFLFTSNVGGWLALYTQALPHGSPILLNGDQEGGGGFQAIVTADGSAIYFLGKGGVWVMKADGSAPHLVVGQNLFSKP